MRTIDQQRISLLVDDLRLDPLTRPNSLRISRIAWVILQFRFNSVGMPPPLSFIKILSLFIDRSIFLLRIPRENSHRTVLPIARIITSSVPLASNLLYVIESSGVKYEEKERRKFLQDSPRQVNEFELGRIKGRTKS